MGKNQLKITPFRKYQFCENEITSFGFPIAQIDLHSFSELGFICQVSVCD